jgi:hypothetical protein
MQDNNNKHDDHIHPWSTRPPNTNEKKIHEIFDKDICKLMNVQSPYMCFCMLQIGR